MNQASAALRKAALNEVAKQYVLSDAVLFKILKKAADRYIGGETLQETISKVKIQNERDFKCSIEFMGESTRTEKDANAACLEFIRICEAIRFRGLNATVSLDLSHIGLAISRDLCVHNLELICKEALKADVEVIISAEGTDRTDAVQEIYKTMAKTHQNVGITLQAYLHRTKDDLADVIRLGGRIRMVKGAFETPAGLSLPRGEQLDSVYMDYVDRLLSSGHLCSIATHHHELQQQAKKLVQHYQVSREVYEFESLYGIQSEQLAVLKSEGHPVKTYFVYGDEWYLYLCNRLAEYPPNVFLAIMDIVA